MNILGVGQEISGLVLLVVTSIRMEDEYKRVSFVPLRIGTHVLIAPLKWHVEQVEYIMFFYRAFVYFVVSIGHNAISFQKTPTLPEHRTNHQLLPTIRPPRIHYYHPKMFGAANPTAAAGAEPSPAEDGNQLINLSTCLDKTACYARNENAGFPWGNLFIGDSRLGMQSDADEQLILHLSFQEFVRVRSCLSCWEEESSS